MNTSLVISEDVEAINTSKAVENMMNENGNEAAVAVLARYAKDDLFVYRRCYALC